MVILVIISDPHLYPVWKEDYSKKNHLWLVLEEHFTFTRR